MSAERSFVLMQMLFPAADSSEPGDPSHCICGVEGGSSPLLALVPAVSWPWVSAWGSLEPPRRDGENAQNTRKNGEEMAEIWAKTCEQGKDRRDQLAMPQLPWDIRENCGLRADVVGDCLACRSSEVVLVPPTPDAVRRAPPPTTPTRSPRNRGLAGTPLRSPARSPSRSRRSSSTPLVLVVSHHAAIRCALRGLLEGKPHPPSPHHRTPGSPGYSL